MIFQTHNGLDLCLLDTLSAFSPFSVLVDNLLPFFDLQCDRFLLNSIRHFARISG